MKGVLFDLENLNQLVRAINTKLLPSRKYKFQELPSAIYDVFYIEINRVRREFHELIYGPKASFTDEYGLIKSIHSSCFKGRTDLKYVCFPECSTIRMGAFDGCTHLSDISFPKASFIEGDAFQSCYALTKITNLPAGSSHYANIFCDCKNLSYASLNWSYIPIGTFSGCDKLTNVIIPSATIISGHAFENCSNLSQINLDSVDTIKGYAFANCISLEEVSLPNCTQIGWPVTYDDASPYAFLNCASLRKVYAPNCSLIYRSAFMNCYALSDIFMPSLIAIPDSFLINGLGLSNISSSNFYNACCIEQSAFMNCQNLESAVFTNVFAVCSDAFKSCNKLQAIEFYGEYNSSYSNYLPIGRNVFIISYVSNLVGLNDSAFVDCISLSTIIFSNLNIIYNHVFSNCTNLSLISFSKCAYIGQRAFYNCFNLEEVHLPNCKVFNKAAFYNCSKLSVINASSLSIIGNATFENCRALKSISFPETYDYASNLWDYVGEPISRIFYNCTSLETVYLPKYRLTSNQVSLFENCINLENLVLSTEGNVIGANMFKNCYKLSDFDFTNIISIYSSAFENCSAITEVIAPNCNALGDHAFKNCTNLIRVQTSTFSFGGSPAKEIFANCYNLEEISFSNGAYGIYGSSIFANCSKLRSIIDVTSGAIYADAFLNCISLVTADLRLKTVTGPRAFANCINLNEVHIYGFRDRYTVNHSIVNDGLYLTFSGCVNLQSLYIHNASIAVPFYSEKLTFYSCNFLNNGHLYVPSSLYSIYIASSMGWINYMGSNRIFSF